MNKCRPNLKSKKLKTRNKCHFHLFNLQNIPDNTVFLLPTSSYCWPPCSTHRLCTVIPRSVTSATLRGEVRWGQGNSCPLPQDIFLLCIIGFVAMNTYCTKHSMLFVFSCECFLFCFICKKTTKESSLTGKWWLSLARPKMTSVKQYLCSAHWQNAIVRRFEQGVGARVYTKPMRLMHFLDAVL